MPLQLHLFKLRSGVEKVPAARTNQHMNWNGKLLDCCTYQLFAGRDSANIKPVAQLDAVGATLFSRLGSLEGFDAKLKKKGLHARFRYGRVSSARCPAPASVDVPCAASSEAGSSQTLKNVPFFVKTLSIVNKYRSFGHSKRRFEGSGCAALKNRQRRKCLNSRRGTANDSGSGSQTSKQCRANQAHIAPEGGPAHIACVHAR